MRCVSFASTHCLSLLKILYFSSSIHGEAIFSITMGCHLAFLSKPVSPAKDSPPWSIIPVWRGTWLSQMDFHPHWSTTTKASCQRCKATSLSETTHSSFVFLLHSLYIMFHTLFSMALQMGSFKCRILLKILRKKKKTPPWKLLSFVLKQHAVPWRVLFLKSSDGLYTADPSYLGDRRKVRGKGS